MRKRANDIKIRLNNEELSNLTAQAKACGYSREAYIRSLLNGCIPRPMPPPEYHALMREMHSIGNNLNQVAQKAHVLNVIDTGRYDAALRMFVEAVQKIEAATILPVKME